MKSINNERERSSSVHRDNRITAIVRLHFAEN
jgi:hypothetical protein